MYGTAEHPYHTFSAHQSRSRMLELAVPEPEPPKAAASPAHAEGPEEEEDYTGKGLEVVASLLVVRVPTLAPTQQSCCSRGGVWL